MIANKTILEVSATMTVGILFVVTLAKAMGFDRAGYAPIARFMFIFCVVRTIPFTISAILALLEPNQYANGMCICAFVMFALFLTLFMWVLGDTKRNAK